MPSVTTLWDAGPLIALIDRSDDDHELCHMALLDLEGHSFTTEAVVTEVHYVLEHVPHAPRVLLQFIDEYSITVLLPDWEVRLRQMELMAKYRDAPMDYGDASLVAAAERLRTNRVFTLDRRHFQTYRLHDREAFDLVP